MPVVEANPGNWISVVQGATPGTTVRLAPGLYGGGEILGLRGRAGAPITIVGASEPAFGIDSPAGSRIDGGVAFEDFRRRGEIEADKLARAGKYPGVYTLAGEATLRLRECAFVELRDLHFQRCWPTAVHLDRCNDIVFDRIMVRGSSYAFYAIGTADERGAGGTRRLRLHACHWRQDDSEDHVLWNARTWNEIHGVGPGTGGYRLYDGSFFHGHDIPGDVEFDRCVVERAFNGIHFFNEKLIADRACDIHVHDCEFRFIRDNPIEPEQRARNWWIHHNRFVDCHKWFSLELFRAGHIYIYANTGWFTSAPAAEPGRGGAVFKFLPWADDLGRYDGPIHVFNNSWCLRSHMFKGGAIARFRHHNNAVVFCQHLEGTASTACLTGKPFGKLHEPPPGEEPEYLTTEWSRLDIAFTNDLVQHKSWPSELHHWGYHRLDGLSGAPMFVDPLAGDFRPRAGSPCLGKGLPLPVELPDGTRWTPPGGSFDIGAVQSDPKAYDGLTFQRLAGRRGA